MYYKKIIILLGTLSLVLILSLFWNYFTIPLKNPNEVIGYLTLKNLNPLNDTLRYILIIIIPLFFYFITNIFFHEFEFKKKKIFPKNHIPEKNNDLLIKDVKLIILILLGYIITDYIFNFNFLNFSLDTFHDGDFLSPAQNFIIKKKIWSSSVTIHGGSNIIYPLLGWKIHNIETIGAYRLFLSYLIIILKILSIFLALQLTKLSNLKKNYKIILFFLLSLILISFSSYEIPLNYSELSIRDLYVVCFLICLIEAIHTNKLKIIYSVFLIIISFLSLTLHIDTAVYLYFILIIYFFYLFIQKKFYLIFKLLFTKTLLLIIFITIFGFEELFAIFKNFFIIVNNIDLIHGLEFPQPFFDTSSNSHTSRATKIIIIQILSGILIMESIFKKKNNHNYKQKIIFIFLYIISFIMFKNALGRSDSYHIRMSSEWPYIISIFFFIEYIFNFLQKKISFKLVPYFIIFFLIIYLFNFKNNFNSILNFKENFKIFLNASDDKYLKEDKTMFINDIQNIIKNEKCIINFTEDNSLLYLLKKASCTKYLIAYLSSGKKLEREYINDLKTNNTTYIIFKSPAYSFDNISINERLKIVNSYIINNYKTIYSKNNYILLEKSN